MSDAEKEYKFRLPDIGEGVSEGEVVTWHVREGQSVSEDQPMVDVMTDKATVTIEVPQAGVVKELCATVGEVIRVGSLMVVIDAEGTVHKGAVHGEAVHKGTVHGEAVHREAVREQPSNAGQDTPQPPDGSGARAVGDIAEELPGTRLGARAIPEAGAGVEAGAKTAESEAELGAESGTESGAESEAESGAEADASRQALATPAVRRLARDLEVNLRMVRGSGPDGRVTREDVVAHHKERLESPSERPRRASAVVAKPHQVRVSSRADERRPLTGLRRKIAEKMSTAKERAAHVTFVEECEVDRLREFRSRLAPVAAKSQIKLTFMPFITKAVALALGKHPELNSHMDDEAHEWILDGQCNLGIAVSTEQGLLVPVVTDADCRSIQDIAVQITELSEGARAGSLGSKELRGSTFTITSLGTKGGLLATPIINYPEVAILGVHRIRERALVRDGVVVPGHTMMLSLSFDHRVVDGHTAASFVYDVIAYLEDPSLMLLEMT